LACVDILLRFGGTALVALLMIGLAEARQLDRIDVGNSYQAVFMLR